MDSTGTGLALPVIILSDDGEHVAQVNGKDIALYSTRRIIAECGDPQVARSKDLLHVAKFLPFKKSISSAFENGRSQECRLLTATDTRISVWLLDTGLHLYAEIDNVDPGYLNVDFGSDENEVIVFHPWHTKLAVHTLNTGRSQIIKAPKFSHNNGYGYRPKTGQLAILLKPEGWDVLTLHETRSYELISRVSLPTMDSQGLKWSCDGKWIAVWDTASAGTRVLIYTAAGQLFRSYNGPSELQSASDLGVKCIEWSPVVAGTATSEFLAIAKVDGNVDLLQCRTFSCCMSFSHAYQQDQCSSVWREICSTAVGHFGYVELSDVSALSAVGEPSGQPRGVLTIAFSPDGNFLVTVDLLRPHIVWIWLLGPKPRLDTVLIHESAVRLAVWHPQKTELLITTASSAVPAVRRWSPHAEPVIVRIPIARNESDKYDVRWSMSEDSQTSMFWACSKEECVLGHISMENGVAQFHSVYFVSAKVNTGSSTVSMLM